MITGKEIEVKYNVSRETIKRRIKDGSLNPIKDKGNVNLFNEDEVEKVFAKKESYLDELKRILKEHYGYDPYEFIGEFKTCNDNIIVKCNRCNNEISIRPGNIKNNIRLNREPPCKYCGAKTSGDKHLVSKEEYEQRLLTLCKGNYTLLGEYKSLSDKTLHRCNLCNYEWEVTPSNLLYSYSQNKHMCPSCNNMVRDNRRYEEKLKDINENIIALEEYKGRKVNILHKCNICGNEWSCSPNNRLRGEGCPKCSNKISQSKNELDLIKFLNDNGIVTTTKNRTMLEGKEIDIFVENDSIGLEMNGNYWHSEKYKGKKYHLEKTELAESKNIRLIQIMDDEWERKQEIVKSKLLYIFKKSNNLPKIYARKCEVREISSSEKNQFLNKNHIQGADSATIKLGLFYNEKLVSVMTFAKPRVSLGQKSKSTVYDYELSRFASDINYIIVGGFNKLFKYFERNYEWKKLISYADRRWSKGDLYLKNNWKHIRNTAPNYWYVDKNLKTRYHRYTFRKQALKDKFPELYDDSKTEFEIMDQTKYFRIWDCGNMVFEYTR